ncbi:conserved hypothetical protein [Culex quinquefasciatus]|uniref:Uncharacterized protein n=1 Tax=Culex quinquefasciatus TaxID=7176 RepID=B0XK35_CULQU|nr:conserved hypothetical protein [Culex quinquefasciatus]|eukprot:XP_001870007.1 conserved hypothetical protein [Culex quinquefasciatus]
MPACILATIGRRPYIAIYRAAATATRHQVGGRQTLLTRDARTPASWKTPTLPSQSRHRSAATYLVPDIKVVPALCTVPEKGSSKRQTQASTIPLFTNVTSSTLMPACILATIGRRPYIAIYRAAATATRHQVGGRRTLLTRDARTPASWKTPTLPSQSRHRSAATYLVPDIKVVPALCTALENGSSKTRFQACIRVFPFSRRSLMLHNLPAPSNPPTHSSPTLAR